MCEIVKKFVEWNSSSFKISIFFFKFTQKLLQRISFRFFLFLLVLVIKRFLGKNMGPLAKIDAIDGKKWVKFVAMQQQCKLNLLFTCNDVSGNCFCTSLQRTKFTCHIMQRACMLRSKVNNYRQMAIAMTFTLHGFNDLGHSVTPIFFSMHRFLYRFSMFCKKMKKRIYVY